MSFVPTSEQQAILSHDPTRSARVLAGPGTGKSATLVALIQQLLSGANPPALRLLTFTRAATGELAKKVAADPATAILRPSTNHSFAIAVLMANPGAANLPRPLRIADPWEEAQLVYPTLARRAGLTVTAIRRLMRELAANWESLQQNEDTRVSATDRSRFYGAWNEHRTIYGYTLLAELPYELLQALRNHPDDLSGIAFDLLVVDEYQDLNACDLEVIRLLSAESGCAVIGAGDDDQSIYSGRKAAPEGIRRFLTDYPGASEYALSITQRCGSRIIEWANHVIEGDPGRPVRPALTPAAGSPEGEVALLRFRGHVAEARGIAKLASKLIERDGLLPADILILLRSDYGKSFSALIKRELDALAIPYSDPDRVDQILNADSNRRALATFRLAARREDSLGWATLLNLEPGVGPSFVDRIYAQARDAGIQFGRALLAEFTAGFPLGPTATANRVRALMADVVAWLDAHPLADGLGIAWGQWMIDNASAGSAVALDPALQELLVALDDLVEAGAPFERYLGQIRPLGRDRDANQSQGIRIMTMSGSKGLTVRATIVAALEEGVIPRPEYDVQEERRFLYVAMSRSKEYLYGTWAARRTGPTARAGGGRTVERRSRSNFLDGGPVSSEDGDAYIARRWS